MKNVSTMFSSTENIGDFLKKLISSLPADEKQNVKPIDVLGSFKNSVLKDFGDHFLNHKLIIKEHPFNNFVLVGNSGTGKTTQAILLAYENFKNGKKVKILTEADLLEVTKYDIKEFLIDLNQYNFLVLDDLGIMGINTETTELAKQIISRRMQSKKYKTVITTNHFITDLLGNRFADKMLEFFYIKKFNGKSFRKEKMNFEEINIEI